MEERDYTQEERIGLLQSAEADRCKRGAEKWASSTDSWLRELGESYLELGRIPTPDEIIVIMRFLVAFTTGSRLLGVNRVADKMDYRLTCFYAGLVRMGYSKYSYYNGGLYQHLPTLDKFVRASAYSGRID